MPVTPAEIKFYLTPGGNSDPAASLGGSGQGSEIGAGLHNIFDHVTPDEAVAGDVEYRAIDVKNSNISDTLFDAVAYISSQTTSSDDAIEVAYEDGEQSVADESTAPTGLTFSAPTSKAEGVSLGDIVSGGTKRIWLKRTVTAGAASTASSSGELTIVGGTV